MKIQAILFMCNDFTRAKFTLENFNKWNPDIPIRVINSGGDCPKPYLEHIPNTEFIDAPNLWHKKTHCGVGSFGPQYYDYFFEYGLNDKYSHTLFLETDILTNRKITIEPKYEISGVTNIGGNNIIYDYLDIDGHKLHSGCGGTLFRHSYFKNIINNNMFSLFYDLFNKFYQYYYMDFISTIVGRKAGCTLGNWEEVSETKPFYSLGLNNQPILKQPNLQATLVHDYKV
jgi:hypothetical protein